MNSEEVDRVRKMVAARVRALRLVAGLTQTELAEKCALRQPAWSAIELGRNSMRVEVLVLAAKALGVRAGDILSGMD